MKKYFLVLVTGLFLLAACSKTAQPTDTTTSEATVASTNNVEIVELTNQQFEMMVGTPESDRKHWHFVSDKPIIVDFYATWCGPCKKMAPNLQQLANTYEGKITVYKVNVEKARESASLFGINSIPTLLFVNPGNGQLYLKSGYQDYNGLKAYVKETFGL